MENPHLIENNFKNYMFYTLRNCHDKKVSLYTWCLNIGVFLAFTIVGGLILYACYKRKQTPYEQNQKLLQEQEYILSKIKYYQNDRKQATSSNITDLPFIYNPDPGYL